MKHHLLYCGLALSFCLPLLCCDEDPVVREECPASARKVGMAYSLWFPPHGWDNVWDQPELGPYQSEDQGVMGTHAQWLEAACVDFLLLDLSNNIEAGPDRPDLLAIEAATDALVEDYLRHDRRLKISFLLGIDGEPLKISNGQLQTKVDALYDTYLAEELGVKQRELFLHHEGKPLLVVYVWAPSPYQQGLPEWDDPRFTVRFMSGWLDAQPALLVEGACAEAPCVSRYGYWSWWDRSPQSYALDALGEPEFMVVSAAFPGETGWSDAASVGRAGGETFKTQWAYAREVGPQIVLVNSFNEWVRPEEQDSEFSNDIEPSEAHGHFYLDLLTEQVAEFKGF